MLLLFAIIEVIEIIDSIDIFFIIAIIVFILRVGTGNVAVLNQLQMRPRTMMNRHLLPTRTVRHDLRGNRHPYVGGPLPTTLVAPRSLLWWSAGSRDGSDGGSAAASRGEADARWWPAWGAEREAGGERAYCSTGGGSSGN